MDYVGWFKKKCQCQVNFLTNKKLTLDQNYAVFKMIQSVRNIKTDNTIQYNYKIYNFYFFFISMHA